MWLYVWGKEIKDLYVWNKKVIGAYVWKDLVRPTTGYTPTANTIAYYPFKNDILDVTWITTLETSWTKSTIGYQFTWIANITNTSNAKFICWWLKIVSSNASCSATMAVNSAELLYQINHISSSYINRPICFSSSNIFWTGSTISINSRYFIATGYDWSKSVCYKNWVKLLDTTYQPITHWSSNVATFYTYWNGGSSTYILSECIVEDTLWSESKILDYYNKTKSNYWL